MANRLNIVIKRHKREIATVYYHWSASTIPALRRLSKLIVGLGEKWKADDHGLQLYTIMFAEDEGGGISPIDSQLEMVLAKYPNKIFKTDTDCDNGWVSISPYTSSFRDGAAEMVIDLDTCYVTSNTIDRFESLGELNDEYDEEYTEKDVLEVSFNHLISKWTNPFTCLTG